MCKIVKMAVSLVPEHLRKPELIFEVSCRGQTPAGDVKGLRAQLRKFLSSPRVWQSSFDVSEELAACETRVEELNLEIEELLPLASGMAKAKLGSQLLHWEARLSLLSQAPGLDADKLPWVSSSAQTLKSAIEELNGPRSVKQILSVFESNPASSGTTQSHVVEPAPAASLLDDNVPEVPPAPRTVAPERVFYSEIGGVNRSGASFSGFGKLPHPLAATLSCLRPVDGLDTDALLSFLEEVFRIREFPGMSDRGVLEIIAPLCLKPLSDRLFDCIRRHGSFDSFHSEVLDFFIPTRVMERLKVERVYRPQAHAETLSQYVGNIKSVANVLRLGFSEEHLVELILQGIKQEERSRLVFCPRPSSLADLDRLSIFSRSVQDADFQRGEPLGYRPQPSYRPAVAPIAQAVRHPQHEREVPVCFGCGRQGHFRRDCRQGRRGVSVPKN